MSYKEKIQGLFSNEKDDDMRTPDKPWAKDVLIKSQIKSTRESPLKEWWLEQQETK